VYIPLARDDNQQAYYWRQGLSRVEENLKLVTVTNANDTFQIGQGKRLVNRHYQRAVLNFQEAFPLRRIPPPGHRVRRGLFNFVGDLASSLFGTPSASDLEALQDAQEALASTVDEVVATQRETVGVVNTLNENQQKISMAVNRVTLQVTALADQFVRVMSANTQWHLLREMIEELLSFRIELTRYVAWMNRMAGIRAACESDSQSELTIASGLLRKLLQTDDVMNYYQYIHTDKLITVNSTLYCVANIPVFKETFDQLYVIETYPVCDSQTCHRIYHHEQIVVDPLSETLYFPENCLGFSPLACRPGVEFPSTAQPCLHGLINGDPALQKQCPLTIYKEHPLPLPGRMPSGNQFVVATPDTTYRYLCPDQRPRTGTFKSGVYLVTVGQTCTMDANLWRLAGTIHKTYFADRPQMPPRAINISITIPTASLTLPPHLSTLEIDTIQTLDKPDSPHMRATIYNYHARIATDQDFWQWVVITLFVIALGLAVVYYLHTKYKCVCNLPGRPRNDKGLLANAPPPAYVTPTTEIAMEELHAQNEAYISNTPDQRV